ncbi:MAG: DUF924 family protein [Chlamydiales bacterium]
MKTLCLLLGISISLVATEPGDILDYWFGDLEHRAQEPKQNSKKWFGGGKGVDNEIRALFYSTYRDAVFGRLNSWKATPRGRLALIIVLDQFPRNLYRESAEAFLADSLALSLALEGIKKGDDHYLLPIEQAFFCMPLQHAEDSQIQELSVQKFSKIAEETDSPSYLYYAMRHKEIIDRFGHFPHRNKRLNRPTTAEEEAFLKEKDSSF